MSILMQIGDDTILNIVFLVVLLILIFYSIYDTYARRPRKRIQLIREQLTCTRCGFSVEREFEPGDFIGLVKGKCPSCKGDLKIKAIYAVEKGKE